jgi:D-3-phosphoglycerate dehydrogenase
MALGTCIYYTCQQLTPECYQLLSDNFHILSLKTPLHDSTLQRANREEVTAVFAPVGYKFTEAQLRDFPNLRAVISNSTSVEHINCAKCSDIGVAVCSLADEQDFLQDITPTAEHTLGLIHALHRRIPGTAIDTSSEGIWDRYKCYTPPKMLSKMTLGIIGMGRIGKMVRNRARSLFKDIYYMDITDTNNSLDLMIQTSDIITLHIDGRPGNRNFVDENFLQKMRPNSLLINTSRGEHVSTGALLKVLRSSHLAGAALDVLPGEHRPMFLKDNKEIFEYAAEHDNLILTPHIAGSTQDAWEITQRRVIEKAIYVCQERFSEEMGESAP